MQLENIFKSILTTLLGSIMMGVSFYGWYTDWLTDYQAGGAGVIGFALLFMRDSIPGFITKLFDAVLSKFSKGNNNPPNQ